MAQYTMTLKQIIDHNINIFDFDYPIFNEEYRKVLEKKIINHYYFYEIGCETVGRFLFNLNEKMNLIMPYYNKIYLSQNLEQRILDNYDVTESYQRNVNNSNISLMNGSTVSKDLALHSDTPNKRIDIATNDYVSNIDKVSSENKNENQIRQDSDMIESWTRTMQGNIGVQTDADAIVKYEGSLKNVDMLIIAELSDLFMQIW